MDYQFITTDQALAAYCEQAMKADAVAVDTEFVRTRTLYPRLGLIQLYDGQSLMLVDPLKITDFSPLVALLTDPSVVKVLHSCSEDLETFWHSLGITPTPVFDTQFAACVVNKGATLGYAALVELMLGETLDKGESRTDWMARPLTPQQCVYAANDVWYLFKLYPSLRDEVIALDRLDWVYQEIEHLARKKRRGVLPELAYLGIKNNWQLNGRALYLLKQLAMWRIKQARSRDLALNFVIRESNLFEIAKRQPGSKGALFNIPGMTPQEARVNGAAVLELVEQAKNVPPEHFPPTIERLVEYPGFKKIAANLRAVCQQVANEQNIPVEIVGSKKQINQLLKWQWFDIDETKAQGLIPDLISGWREALLRSKLEQVLGTKFTTDA